MKDAHAVEVDRPLCQKLAHNSVKVGLYPRNALHGESALYEVFHENTKLGALTGRAVSAWATAYMRLRADRTPLQGGKVYSLMERRALAPVQARTELERTIEARRSTRSFSGASIDIDELSRLLFFSYGRTDRHGPFRAVASGGGLYPLELYVAAFAVDGLEAGLYHYGVETNHLDVVKTGDCRDEFTALVHLAGIDLSTAAMGIVVTAAFRRSTIKYLDRGYRMVLMEAGEVVQNMGLVATSMELGLCLVGGFHDDRLSEFLEIDGVEEAPLLAAVVGRPADGARA